jgi:hypothetical protein
MTRKDYERIAEVLASVGSKGDIAAHTCAEVGARLIEYFESENPRFDRQRFRDAYMTTLWEMGRIRRAKESA